MSAIHTQRTKRTRRSFGFGALLLMLVHLVQPALALAGGGCADRSDGSGPACCCSAEVNDLQAPKPEAGCCSEDQEETGQLPDGSDATCGCRTDSTPIPSPEPALPPRANDSTSGCLLTDWVRSHAELSAIMRNGSPGMHLPPTHGTGLSVFVGLTGVETNSPGAGLMGSSAWTLLLRGVNGLLAALSVVRI